MKYLWLLAFFTQLSFAQNFKSFWSSPNCLLSESQFCTGSKVALKVGDGSVKVGEVSDILDNKLIKVRIRVRGSYIHLFRKRSQLFLEDTSRANVYLQQYFFRDESGHLQKGRIKYYFEKDMVQVQYFTSGEYFKVFFHKSRLTKLMKINSNEEHEQKLKELFACTSGFQNSRDFFQIKDTYPDIYVIGIKNSNSYDMYLTKKEVLDFFHCND